MPLELHELSQLSNAAQTEIALLRQTALLWQNEICSAAKSGALLICRLPSQLGR